MGTRCTLCGVQVRETKPGTAISIIETDCQTDFDAPKDYKVRAGWLDGRPSVGRGPAWPAGGGRGGGGGSARPARHGAAHLRDGDIASRGPGLSCWSRGACLASDSTSSCYYSCGWVLSQEPERQPQVMKPAAPEPMMGGFCGGTRLLRREASLTLGACGSRVPAPASAGVCWAGGAGVVLEGAAATLGGQGALAAAALRRSLSPTLLGPGPHR
jgi:hypothetical protein